MSAFPSLFISHGGPDMLLYPSPVLDFLTQLGHQLETPKAILVISAHWLSSVPTVSTASSPKTIHDFWGFPAELYQLQYAAPGAPDLAQRVTHLLTQAGLESQIDPNRGLDHGAWEPLKLIYPEATIPVTQLSIQPQAGTVHHVELGRALAPLRNEGVLILASGTATHNLRAFETNDLHAEPIAWASEFDQWLAGAIATSNLDALLHYRKQAPHAVQSHPTEEHLLPLFVALGAGSDPIQATQLHHSFIYGTFSMAAYAFH